jgi:hypothetical protein
LGNDASHFPSLTSKSLLSTLSLILVAISVTVPAPVGGDGGEHLHGVEGEDGSN